ncbi:MAG: cytochrome c [Gammaproteobacteria bacterium]|jgi:mono/diheme cytochrome c family protein
MKYLKISVAVVIIFVVLATGTILSGIYNVAATEPHSLVTGWLLEAIRENSVRHHADGIRVPDLKNADMVREGAEHYREMCVGCHLAPGLKNTEIRQGLNPEPPDLTRGTGELTPAETYWVVKHGIRMTGMPAWGVTHSDDKIWAIVAFLQRLPDLSAVEFKQLSGEERPASEETAPGEMHEHPDEHGHATEHDEQEENPPGSYR